MTELNHERYIIRKPLYESDAGIKNHQGPSLTYMSNKLVPNVNNYLEYRWINGIPEPNPYIHEHIHDLSVIILFIGGDPNDPEDLGGEIEFHMGGQPLMFNKSSALFIPAGVLHGPVIWKEFSKPHIHMTLMMGSGDAFECCETVGIEGPVKKASQKSDNVDYERYLVRKPIYERSPGIKNRQSPTMTYMSSNQVPEADYYIEYGWIYDIPEPNPHVTEHVHENDELILHFGGDPKDPEDLGGMIELHVGGEPFIFNTTFAVFAPRGLYHCPVIWKEFRKPHVEMAITLGSGRR